MGQGLIAKFFSRIFDDSQYLNLGVAGFGFFIAWIWLGLASGLPFCESGMTHKLPILMLMVPFSATVALIWLLTYWGKQPHGLAILIVGTVLATGGTALAAFTYFYDFGFAGTACSFILIGIGGALLALSFGAFFSQLDLDRLLRYFAFATIFAFVGYFVVITHNGTLRYVYYIGLPLLAGILITASITTQTLADIAYEIPERIWGFPKGFASFLGISCFCFFAMSFMRAVDDPKDFALSPHEAVIYTMVVLLALMLICRKLMSPVRALQILYLSTACILICSIVIARMVIRDVYSLNAILDTSCLLMILFFWMTTALVAHSFKLNPYSVFAIVLFIMGLSLLGGWEFGKHLYTQIGLGRDIFNSVVACAAALGCAFCFTAKTIASFAEGNTPAVERVSHGQNHVFVAAPVQDILTSQQIPVLRQEQLQKLSKTYGLTTRELEVAELLADGLKAQAIAQKLYVSYYTARAHISHIYTKMDVHSQQEFVEKMESSD